MSPKRKAIELYKKFDGWVNEELPHTSTIKCALIAVDEMIKQLQAIDLKTGTWDSNCSELRKYWNEVKTEIEKL